MIRVISIVLLLLISSCNLLEDPVSSSLDSAPFLQAVKQSESISLSWSNFILQFGGVTDQDPPEVRKYHILRSGTTVEDLTRIAETKDRSFLDEEVSNGSYLYAIEAETKNGDLVRSNIVMASPEVADVQPVYVLSLAAPIGGFSLLSSGESLVETQANNGDSVILIGNPQQNQIFQLSGWNPVPHPTEPVFLFVRKVEAQASGMSLSLFSLTDSSTVDLVSGFGLIEHPEWNADGTSIVFLTSATAGGSTSIRSIPFNSLVNVAPVLIGPPPSYSGAGVPGPQHPVFSSIDPDQIIADFPAVNRGSVVRDILQTSSSGDSTILSSPWLDTHPAINPAGTHMAFVSDRSGVLSIWLLELDRGRLRQLTGKPTDPVVNRNFQLRWAESGNRIWYTGAINGNQSCFELTW